MKFKHLIIVIFPLALSAFFGCTSQKELTYLNNLDTTAVSQFFPMERPDYRIQYQDILYVNVFTINQEQYFLLNPGSTSSSSMQYRDESNIYVNGYTVNDSGMISLPILGKVQVQGLTIGEVNRAVQERADQFLKRATVNVKLLSFKFTVLGEVNRPGSYTNYNNQLTVLEAIGVGGDITVYGDRSRVLVIRPTKKGSQTFRINLQDKNILQSEGYFLLPNDVVIVEPIGSKPFSLNLPITSLIITATISTISTTILLLNFLKPN